MDSWKQPINTKFNFGFFNRQEIIWAIYLSLNVPMIVISFAKVPIYIRLSIWATTFLKVVSIADLLVLSLAITEISATFKFRRDFL